MNMATNDACDPLTDGLMGDFLDESTDLMRRLNEGLLQLDLDVKSGSNSASTNEELLNDIFRAAHSLKGLSGMLGLQNINALTHKVENVFDAVRSGRMSVVGSVVDVSFQAIDRLDAMIELLKSGENGDVAYTDVIDRIEVVLRGEPQSEIVTDPMRLVPPTQMADVLADIQDDVDIPAKYLGIFIDECELTLDALSDTLLQEIQPSQVESLLVGCHRIKGSAASIGLRRVARLAHLMEDHLQELRRIAAVPTGEMVDALFKSVDAIRAYVNGLRTGRPDTNSLGDACRWMVRISPTNDSSPANSASSPTSPPPSTNDWQRAVRAAIPPDVSGYLGHVVFDENLALVELKARLLLEKIQRFGNLFYASPAEDELDSIHELTSLSFGLATQAELTALRQELNVTGVLTIDWVPFQPHTAIDGIAAVRDPAPDADLDLVADEVTAPTGDGAAASSSRSTTSSPASSDPKSKPTETLRVDIERLDQLMSLAGQLVITKARFSQIGQKLKRLFSDKLISNCLADAIKQTERLSNELHDTGRDRLPERESLFAKTQQIHGDLNLVQRDLVRFGEVRGMINDLSEAIHQLDRVSDGIQSSVMDTRMVPIGPLFSRFKRVVRDLGRSSGKEINLAIHGEHTELDKRMIDELGDPLIHLIRNSADHGIEAPEGRAAAGKSRHGTITLNAFHRGNRIVIQVTDDGRGLDAARIRAKAVAKGWMNELEAEKMTDAQVYQLIWRPGFSTAERVTEVSGRGMGMDIVGSKIEQLNGLVELSSKPGLGTTFEIKLPLTMAILPSLLMVIGADVFAVPVESVIEIVRVAEHGVTTVYGRPTTRVRGRVISLVRLSDLFGDTIAATDRDPANLTVVIVGSEGREIGIVVNDLLGEQDVVIKSLTENFQNIDGIAGASILGDGRVSLILDVTALLQMACSEPRGTGAGS